MTCEFTRTCRRKALSTFLGNQNSLFIYHIKLRCLTKHSSKVSRIFSFVSSVYLLKCCLINGKKRLVSLTPCHLQILMCSAIKVSYTFPGNEHLLPDLSHSTAVLDKKSFRSLLLPFLICRFGLPLKLLFDQ